MTSKAEVDKHVETLVAKLPLKEFKSRAYSVAMLYFRAGDYLSARRYVEQYLSQKEGDAAAHKLLAQALHRLGEKEKALEQYKTALEIDPKQTALILDICELLSDDEVYIDPGRARYWCERAEAAYPRHPATFGLRERLLKHADADPAALITLLTSELQTRPKDAALHARLLRLHLTSRNYNDAFQHGFDVEFGDHDAFRNNLMWYDALAEVLALFEQGCRADDWRYRLLKLTVAERAAALALAECPGGAARSLSEAGAALHRYDCELHRAAAPAAAPAGAAEFHTALLHHHRAQFAFHAATFLLKKAKKEQLSWREATRPAAPLLLHAWHASPLPLTAPWLTQAPEHQLVAARRWHLEGSYRCSQTGHCLLSGVQERGHSFVDRVSQYCSGTQWKDKLYEKLFTSREQQSQAKVSHFLSQNFANPNLRLPRRSEVHVYDIDAQKMYPNSLHHMVWMLIDYRSYSQFKCVLFDMLRPASQNYPNCGPETLNRRDVEAFLYAAALTSSTHERRTGYQAADQPQLLPANITDSLCSLMQMKWWDCAYKVSQNEIGTELSDIRVTLRRGMEAVRCVDNHGLDPHLLCKLAEIFSERANVSTQVDEKDELEARAALYYSSAIPLLERLKSKMTIRMPDKRIFEYTHKELNSKEIAALLEESKLYLGEYYMNENEHEKAVETLTGLKSAQASLLLSKIYNKMAFEKIDSSKEHLTSEDRSKHIILLSKAKDWAYTTSERLKGNLDNKLKVETQELIEKIENAMSRIDPDMSNPHDYDGNSSDDNDSSGDSRGEPMHLPPHTRSLFRNNSSTPKHRSNSNATHYRSALDTHTLEASRSEHKHFERIESQIKNLNKENRQLGDEVRDLKNNLADKIISSINTNIQDTVDQFKLLKLSVDQVKEKIGEYRDESRTDVGALRKEVAELKKEVTKLKSSSAERTIDESDLYNLEEEYQANESTPAFSAQLPFGAPPVLPTFNQRMVPPVLPPAAYASIYGQNLYTLYNQFSQLAQTPPAPPGPLFDPARQPNYPSMFPSTEPLYAEVPHFLPQVAVPPVPPAVVAPTATQGPPTAVATRSMPAMQNKEIPRSIPVNVVITSSDPLPMRTTAPQPVLSVTVPPQHIKNSPHNYQITLPETTTSASAFSGNATQMKTFGLASSNTTISWTPKEMSTFESPKTIGTLFDSPKLDLSGFNATFASSPNTSLNKSRTLSEKSNTSVDNYDPCPDFKPIIPLPAEVQVTTGEENESSIFSARAKLYRFAEKQWKERGLGEMKLLKHKVTGKVRVLMRREQVHKICANHIITPEMDLQPMKNESNAYVWVANDFADETLVLEKFCIRFKTADIAKEFHDTFEHARKEAKSLDSGKKLPTEQKSEAKSAGFGDQFKPPVGSWRCTTCYLNNAAGVAKCIACQSDNPTLAKAVPTTPLTSKPPTEKSIMGGFTFSGTPTFQPAKESDKEVKTEEKSSKPNPFSALSFKTQTNSPFANIFSTMQTASSETPKSDVTAATAVTEKVSNQLNTSDVVEEFEPSVEFKPVVPLPALVEQKTGEEDETIVFEHRSKLLRFDSSAKEWKERGLGNIKLLVHKNNDQKVRLLMRREIVMKVCCNHGVTKDMKFQKMSNQDKAVTWCAKDFSEGELILETFCLRFKTADTCNEFMKAIESIQSKLSSQPTKEESSTPKQTTGFGDKFKPKPGSWSCPACYTSNVETASRCVACEQPKVSAGDKKDKSDSNSNLPLSVANWGDKFKPKAGSWECTQCLIRNDANLEYCSACEYPKDPSKPKKEPKSIFDGTGTTKFTFGIPQTTADTNKAQPPAGVTFGINNQPKPAVSFSFTPATTVLQKTEEISKATPFGQLVSGPKPSPFSTPTKESSFAMESNTFGFVMKPKSPGKGKSPLKSPQSDRGEPSDDGESYSGDEGHHIHFTPVIPLPDKVDVTTGEEQETELYSHRAKLFRFVAGEWKERGIGNVKVLKHKENGKLRVLMRREQILKICLNHTLTQELIYTNKDDKTWLFTAHDFSEGELSLHQFCLRFKNKEIAAEFKQAVDEARSSGANKKEESDDVLFVGEIQATSEEKIKAKQLMLPENFFAYKRRAACPGCRGCEEHSEETEQTSAVTSSAGPSVSTGSPAITGPLTSNFLTPTKSILSETSPTNSVFTTPMNVTKMADTSIFRTPMESSGDENTVSDSSDDDRSNVTKTKSTKVSSTTKSPVLAPPKLSTASSEQAELKPGDKSIFGDENKPVFGIPSGTKSDVKQPMFGLTGDQKLGSVFGTAFNQNADNKSVFGSSNQKPATVFGSSEQKPSSVFGLTDQKPASIFGLTDQKPATVFGSSDQKPATVFGSSDQKPATVFGVTQQKPASVFGSTDQKTASLFGSGDQKSGSVFGSTVEQKTSNKSVFGSTEQTPASVFGSAFNQKQDPKQVFGSTTDQKTDPKSVFGNPKSESLFGFSPAQNQNINPVFGSTQPESQSIFGSSLPQQGSIFGVPKQANGTGNVPFDSSKSFFGSAANSTATTPNLFSELANTAVKNSATSEANPVPFSTDGSLSFAALSSNGANIPVKKSDNFQWEGAGQQLFTQKAGAKDGSRQRPADLEQSAEGEGEGEAEGGAEEEYDPHYEPIVPLPDKIVVTTGEEDEEKLFCERAKVFRYDDKAREWKERGVGEMKLLHHPARNTYRLLLRREQVHKAVLNMLLFKDLELLPMKQSSHAWTWAAVNYAENPSGEMETLACRFKSAELADAFRDKVVDAVRKLQAADAAAIRVAREAEEAAHLPASVERLQPARAFFAPAQPDAEGEAEGEQQAEEYEGAEYDAVEYDAGPYDEDYEYSNEDEEQVVVTEASGAARVAAGGAEARCEEAALQLLLDHDMYGHKLVLTDGYTGEILSDIAVCGETPLQRSGKEVTWSGTDYLTGEAVEKTIVFTFPSIDACEDFYNTLQSCRTDSG